MHNYVHGYTDNESQRLNDQANTLDELLHFDTIFPQNSRILEAGCGIGSQTKIIAPKNPACQFISIDISSQSIKKAESVINDLNITNVEFQIQDICNLSFPQESFDHIFICFVLEHLSNPFDILMYLKNFLRKNGTITVIEGDHGSAFYYPQSELAQKAINCQVKLQALNGGNALIGREIFPLLQKSGFIDCQVDPRMVYADSTKPHLVEEFTRNTFTAMIRGIEKNVLKHQLMTEDEWEQGIKDLYRTAEPDGIFCYTFFKGKARKGSQ